MPTVQCLVPSCDFVTEDLDSVVIAALLNAHATVHTMTTHASSSAKVEKVKRPTISSAGSSEDWSYFISRWKDYVEATKVTGKDLVVQLLECCDETLHRDLTRSAGGSPEAPVLEAIQVLAVREENTMVAHVTFHSMTQDRDDTVHSFGARLRGQAGVCKFVIPCPGCHDEVNYTEAILQDVLTRGLNDPEIQLDLFGDKNQHMTLVQAFQFVEAKEAGKRSASRLLDTQGAEAVSSTNRSFLMSNNDISKQYNAYSFCLPLTIRTHISTTAGVGMDVVVKLCLNHVNEYDTVHLH